MPVQRTPITGPFKGIITDLPPTAVLNGFEDSINFIGWKGRQRTRPGLTSLFSSPDSSPVLNMTSFTDVENFLHTVALTGNNAYMLTAGPVLNLLTYPSTYINSIIIDSGGLGYLVDDIITITQGSAILGTAQVNSVSTADGVVTGISGITVEGTGYVLNDVLTLIQSGASGATVQVATVSGGAVTSVTLLTGGTGYTTAIGLAVAGGSGASCQISVTAPASSGAVTSLVLLTGGVGYSTATGLATSGGTGSGLTVNITVGALSSLGGYTSTQLPYAVVKANGRVYFCNGSVPLCYIDGEAMFKVSGNVPGACRFLTANQGHLIGAVWSEPDPTQSGSTLYANRVRWSDSGNYDQWDTTLDTSTAGVVDVSGTPDVLAGLSTLGTYSYIYRTNGISIMQPTGVAAEPFYIPNYSVAPKGEGCKYPYTLDTLSNIDRFVGNYDVCSFDGSNLQHLMDGKCASKFFSDLQGASGTVRGFHTLVLDNGFPFMGYVVTIPGTNVAWILNISEQSWNRLMWNPPTPLQTGFSDLQFIEQVYLT